MPLLKILSALHCSTKTRVGNNKFRRESPAGCIKNGMKTIGILPHDEYSGGAGEGLPYQISSGVDDSD